MYDDRSGASSSAIKLIASVTMLIDHLAHFLSLAAGISDEGWIYLAMRSIGRLSFPLFCFLLSEGMERSSDRIRYLTRLLLCAAVSQLPYSLLFGKAGEDSSLVLAVLCIVLLVGCAFLLSSRTGKAHVGMLGAACAAAVVSQLRFETEGTVLLAGNLNVLYTLSLAAFIIALFQQPTSELSKARSFARRAAAWSLAAALLLFYGPYCSYPILGTLLPVFLWLERDSRVKQVLVITVWSFLSYAAYLPFLAASLTAAALILFYTGRSGRWPLPRRFLYWFYPAHLLMLGALFHLLKGA